MKSPCHVALVQPGPDQYRVRTHPGRFRALVGWWSLHTALESLVDSSSPPDEGLCGVMGPSTCLLQASVVDEERSESLVGGGAVQRRI